MRSWTLVLPSALLLACGRTAEPPDDMAASPPMEAGDAISSSPPADSAPSADAGGEIEAALPPDPCLAYCPPCSETPPVFVDAGVPWDCECGGDPRVGCNPDRVCGDGGFTIVDSGACSPPLPPGCPDLATASKGGACDGGPETLRCYYDDGTCACLDDADGGGSTWRCVTPQSGCPDHRPALGSPCDGSIGSCAYGDTSACGSVGGDAVECADGVWGAVPKPPCVAP